MTIQKPFSISLKDQVVDCSKAVPVSWKNSGDTSASFSISVYKNSDGSLVYNLPRTYSYAMSYTIPAGSIPNGQVYQIAIQVWNGVGDSTATSQLVIFTASSTPTVTVNSIGTVANNSYFFSGVYAQAENNPLNTYTVNLYNSSNVLLNTSGALTDNLMEYRFDGLKNGYSYFVEFVVTSKLGLTSSSGLVAFNVSYDNPSIHFDADVENIPDSASMKITWSVRQIVGKTTIDTNFINSDELDIRGGTVYFDQGFEISDDFTFKIWLQQFPTNTDLVYLKGSNGTIRLQYKTTDNCFHVYKTVNGKNYHYTYYLNMGSNVGVFVTPYQYIEFNNNSDAVFIGLQQKSGRMDIYGEIIVDPYYSLSGTTFNSLSGKTFNDIANATF